MFKKQYGKIMSFFKTLFRLRPDLNFKGTADRSTGLVWLTYHIIVVFTFGLRGPT